MSPEDDEARLAAATAMVTMGRDHMAARMRSMLPQSPTGPMEDHDLMALEFTAQTFLVAAHIPSYADWFANCDMEPTYRYEKRVLKLLQWKTTEKRWRLKSPTHTMFLEAYEKVFPEARFVQTHRDVSSVLPSVSDLYYSMLQGGNPGIDPLYVGTLNMDQWGIALDRCLAFRADPTRDAKFFDMGFTEFQADPIAEIGKLYGLARRRAHRGHGRAHARVAGRQPEGQVRQARVRRRELRDHRRCVAPTFRALPEPVRIVPRVTCT